MKDARGRKADRPRRPATGPCSPTSARTGQHRRPRQGDRDFFQRSWRPRHDDGGDRARSTPRRTGTNSSRRSRLVIGADAEHLLRRYVTATLASSRGPCALTEVGRRLRPRRRRDGRRPTGLASFPSINCRNSTTRASGFVFNANNAHRAATAISRSSAATGRRRSAPGACSSSWTRSTSTARDVGGDAGRPSVARRQIASAVHQGRIEPSGERAREAQAMLVNWNGVMDQDRPEPLIYTAFLCARCMAS